MAEDRSDRSCGLSEINLVLAGFVRDVRRKRDLCRTDRAFMEKAEGNELARRRYDNHSAWLGARGTHEIEKQTLHPGRSSARRSCKRRKSRYPCPNTIHHPTYGRRCLRNDVAWGLRNPHLGKRELRLHIFPTSRLLCTTKFANNEEETPAQPPIEVVHLARCWAEISLIRCSRMPIQPMSLAVEY